MQPSCGMGRKDGMAGVGKESRVGLFLRLFCG